MNIALSTWDEAQDAVLLANPRMTHACLSELVSKVGPYRSADACKERRYRLALNRKNGLWSDDRISQMRKLWEQGLSCSQIAAALNCGMTRNAIIGKTNRLGWKRENTSVLRLPYPERAAPKMSRKRQQPTAPFQSKSPNWRDDGRPVAPTPPKAVTDIESPNAAPWTQRQAGQCAYPVDGEGADVRSCCNFTIGAYCVDHHRLMYRQGTEADEKAGVFRGGLTFGDRSSRAREKTVELLSPVDRVVIDKSDRRRARDRFSEGWAA